MSAGLPLLQTRLMATVFSLNRGEKKNVEFGPAMFIGSASHWTDTSASIPLRLLLHCAKSGLAPGRQLFARGHRQCINGDLRNDLGQSWPHALALRLIGKHCAAAVPEPGAFSEADRAMLDQAEALPEKVRGAMEDFALHQALAEIWAVVGDANRYFASQEPWALRKSDPARMATVLYVTAEVLRIVGILVQPFIPDSASKLLDLLAVSPDQRRIAAIGEDGRLAPGAALPAPQPVFPRFVEPEAS